MTFEHNSDISLWNFAIAHFQYRSLRAFAFPSHRITHSHQHSRTRTTFPHYVFEFLTVTAAFSWSHIWPCFVFVCRHLVGSRKHTHIRHFRCHAKTCFLPPAHCSGRGTASSQFALTVDCVRLCVRVCVHFVGVVDRIIFEWPTVDALQSLRYPPVIQAK